MPVEGSHSTQAVAIIPARGGSKRIPRKNVRPISGRPLIAWAIDSALQSGEFEKVIVSTDDDEIADIALACGADVPFRRPIELADDFTPTIPVIAHAIETLRAQDLVVDEVCCIYPGAIFVTPTDLTRARQLLHAVPDADYVMAVVEYAHPIQRALAIAPSGLTIPVAAEHKLTRTQDLPPRYFDAGQFYWGHARAWIEAIPVHERAAAYVLKRSQAVDIDTNDDWFLAERLHALRLEI